MDERKIERINELAKKAKVEGLKMCIRDSHLGKSHVFGNRHRTQWALPLHLSGPATR